MKAILKPGAIIITLGTGGVGKTTIAAGLALAAARKHHTAVITVDPARRLRDALGLEHLGGRPTAIGRQRLAAAGLDPGLRLAAMVLDVKGAWDSLVERMSTDPQTRARILQNPFYRQLSSQFAGSEAYAALEQLYNLHSGGEFELTVVDTPPAANAFEFLHAPAHLSRLLDSNLSRWLFAPSVLTGRFAMRLASRAARFVIRELERFAGAGVLSSIADFFEAAQQTVEEMLDRLEKTDRLLRSPAVRYVLVTTAEQGRLEQAKALIGQMADERLTLSAIVINRFLDENSWAHLAAGGQGLPAGLESIAELSPQLQAGPRTLRPGQRALLAWLEEYRRYAYQDLVRVAQFARDLPPTITLSLAPELGAGVRGLRGLARVADYLLGLDATLKLNLAGLAARIEGNGAGVNL